MNPVRDPEPRRTRVAILGGGPAGLGAAYRLSRRGGFKVTLVERNRAVGGNSGSFEVAGIPVDYGSHRLHPSCHPAVLSDIRRLLGEDLLEQPRHGRILLEGRWIHFPLKPLDLALRLPPSFVLGVGIDAVRRFAGHRRASASETFESIMRSGVGKTISEKFYFPYARKIWGLDPAEISPVQAQRRVSAGSLTALVKKAARGLLPSSRPAGRFFYYPRHGFGQIASSYARAAEESGAEVRLNTSVTRIRRTLEGWRVEYKSPESKGTIEADHIWSTIPLTTLVRSLEPPPPADVLEAGAAISFRAMILIYLVLETPQFTEFDAHYFPGPEVAVSRVSEPRNYRGAMEPANRTVLCGELPCSPQDAYWRMSDEELGRTLAAALEKAGLPVFARVIGTLTRRLRYAYPIYEIGYERPYRRLESWLADLEGLITFGRQGLFAHDNTHHALFMAYAADECLDGQGRFDRQRWRECLEMFKSHVVED